MKIEIDCLWLSNLEEFFNPLRLAAIFNGAVRSERHFHEKDEKEKKNIIEIASSIH